MPTLKIAENFGLIIDTLNLKERESKVCPDSFGEASQHIPRIAFPVNLCELKEWPLR